MGVDAGRLVIGRRAVLSSLGVVVVAPRAAFAQSPPKPAKIGWLSGQGVPTSYPIFIDALREAGFVAGQNLTIERFAPEGSQAEKYPDLARRLVAGRPDVILAANPHSITAVARTTTTVPIVAIDLESDPIARGWVASLARPGGNVTGVFLDIPEMTGKQLQFLTEAKRDVTRVGVLGDPRINELQFRAAEDAARTAGIDVHRVEARRLEEAADAVSIAARARAGALLVLTSPLVLTAARTIAEAAVKHQLPTISLFMPTFAEAGGLLAYGPTFSELFRRAATYVVRILQGTKAAELPVQRPEKFELVINLKTARALKLTLQQALLGRADRLIE